MISSGGDLKVCGLLLVQTERMVWPWMRAWTPLAMVSTSGSSGMAFCKYRWRPVWMPCASQEEICGFERDSAGYTCRLMKKTILFCGCCRMFL